jgi:hypothetical protein
MPDLPLLRVTSSLIFLPAFIALALGRWTDVVVISTQGICSVWFHSTHSKLSLYADQTSILILATHTLGLALTNSVTPYLFVLGFGYMAVVFSYGKRNNCFCFDPDETVGNRYHASIHILGITIYSVSMIFFLK